MSSQPIASRSILLAVALLLLGALGGGAWLLLSQPAEAFEDGADLKAGRPLAAAPPDAAPPVEGAPLVDEALGEPESEVLEGDEALEGAAFEEEPDDGSRGRIRGQVKRPDGSPAAFAKVYLEQGTLQRRRGRDRALRRIKEVQADSRGYFLFDEVRRRGGLHLDAYGDNCFLGGPKPLGAPAELWSDPSLFHVLELQEGAERAVIVEGADEVELGQLGVRLEARGHAGRDPRRRHEQTLAGREGRLRGLRPGTIYRLRVNDPRVYERRYVDFRTPAAGEEADPIVLKVGEFAHVVGRVVDPSGQPVPGFRIGFANRISVLTDDEGNFELKRERATGRNLTMIGLGAQFEWWLESTEEPLAEGDRRLGQEFVAQPCGSLTATLFREGQLFAPKEATLSIPIDRRRAQRFQRMVAQVDDALSADAKAGRRLRLNNRTFTMTLKATDTGVMPIWFTRRAQPQVRVRDYALLKKPSVQGLSAGETRIELDLEFRALATLSGAILAADLDGRGRLLRNVQIAISNDTFSRVVRLNRRRDKPKFRIRELPPGLYSVTAYQVGDGKNPAKAGQPMAPIALVGGQTRELDLLLGAGGTVTGRVTYPDGAPVPGIMVYAGYERPKLSNASARTDANGSYVLSGLAAGSMRISTGNEGVSFRSPLLTLPSLGSATVDAVLRRPIYVAVRLLDRSRMPLAGHSIFWNGKRGRGNSTSDAQGRARFPCNQPGEYTLYARAEDQSVAATTTFTIEKDMVEGPQLVLTLLPSYTVDGYIVGNWPKSPEGLNVTAVGVVNRNLTRRAKADAQGRFRIPGLYPGEYRITLPRGWPIEGEARFVANPRNRNPSVAVTVAAKR